MGAGQSTTQKITNDISNLMKLKAESIQSAVAQVQAQNIVDMQDVEIYGDLTIEQSAEIKAVMDMYIDSLQNFEVNQAMINDIAAQASQEAANLTLSINVQDIDQEITNILNNEVDIQQVVRSSCDIAANALNQARFRNVIAHQDVTIRQKALADVSGQCLLANQQYAEAMQKIDNKVTVAAKQTVKDVIGGIIAIIMLGMVGMAVAKAAGSAASDKKFIEAAQKEPTLWIIWLIPLLLTVGTLFAMDCGGLFPFFTFPLLNIPIPPSMCRDGNKEVDAKICEGFWPFRHSCTTIIDPETGEPKKKSVPKYRSLGLGVYVAVLSLLAIFMILQLINYFRKKDKFNFRRPTAGSKVRSSEPAAGVLNPGGGQTGQAPSSTDGAFTMVPVSQVINFSDF